jgi:tetratricopeptide (TPR) repeat protein
MSICEIFFVNLLSLKEYVLITVLILKRMDLKKIKNIVAIVVMSAIFGTSLNAQTRGDVIKVYNEGAKSMQTDLPSAIKAFEEVVSLSDQVGETANDLKQKAVQVLPGLYVKAASSALNEKKPPEEIISAARAAVEAAGKYGSEPNKENAERILVQGYYNMGTDYFSKKEYDNALLAFDSLLQINPDYAFAYYNKALIYRTQNDPDAFEGSIDSFLEKMNSANDTVRARQGSTLALEYFRAAGSQANQAENLDQALTLLEKAAKYGDDKDLFYYFADVYNKQKNFNSGAEYAQRGLDLETGNAEAKAKFYYQLAVAQAGKGENANACASFKNAMYGPFAEASKAQRTNLKCE